jgi:putative intracellular protease/amidase
VVTPAPVASVSLAPKEKSRVGSRRKQSAPVWPRALGIAAVVGGVIGLVSLAAWALVTRDRPGETAHNVPAPAGQAPRQVLHVLPAQGLWYPDFGPVRDELEAKGYIVKVASSRGGFSELAMHSPGRRVSVDVVLGEQVRARDYAALVFAGVGVEEYCRDTLPQCRQVRRLIAEMQQAERPVAALCAGQLVLAAAGTLQGKRVALNDKVPNFFPSHGAISDRSAGAVVDGNLITGARPEDAPTFAAKLLERLQR